MEISGFGIVLLFLSGGAMFLIVTLFVGRLLRPSRPDDEKLSTYESGEVPVGSAWGIFNVRFYVIALVFLLFEVELVFLFPWAIVFGDADKIAATNGLWGWFSLAETIIFIGILAVGLVYVWANGMLDWVKPKREQEDFKTNVPEKLYKDINKKYA